MRGKLIVIEGLDGSGKATQSALLYDKLKDAGKEPVKLAFPDYSSPSSSLVKMYLGGEFSDTPEGVNPYAASSFYAVDRCAGFLKNWKKEYEQGRLFIADRYATSNIIYQMSKLPPEEWDTFIGWLEDYEYNKLSIPRPDKVIYLDMSIEVSQKLLSERYHGDDSKKDIHESDIHFLSICRKSALYAAHKLGWSVIRCDSDGSPRKASDIAFDINDIVNDI